MLPYIDQSRITYLEVKGDNCSRLEHEPNKDES